MQRPAAQARQAHQHAEHRRHHGHREERPHLRERGDRQQRDRDGQQRIGQVELVVAEVERVVALLVGLGLLAQFVLLGRLLGRQRLVMRDRLPVAVGGRLRRAKRLQLQLRQRRLGDLLAGVAGLVEGPVVDLVGLRLLHVLVDVVVLDLADAHEGRQQCDGHRHDGIEPRRARGGLGPVHGLAGVLDQFFGVDVHRRGIQENGAAAAYRANLSGTCTDRRARRSASAPPPVARRPTGGRRGPAPRPGPTASGSRPAAPRRRRWGCGGAR